MVRGARADGPTEQLRARSIIDQRPRSVSRKLEVVSSRPTVVLLLIFLLAGCRENGDVIDARIPEVCLSFLGSQLERDDIPQIEAALLGELEAARAEGSTEVGFSILSCLGQFYERQGRLRDALGISERMMQDAEATHWTYYAASRRVADLSERLGDIDRAEREWSRLANAAGQTDFHRIRRIEWLGQRGAFYQRNGREAEAEASLSEAIAAAATDPAAQHLLGWLLEELELLYRSQSEYSNAADICERRAEVVARTTTSAKKLAGVPHDCVALLRRSSRTEEAVQAEREASRLTRLASPGEEGDQLIFDPDDS